MKAIRIRNGFFALLIFEAAIIGLATIAFMINLYNIYTNLVYNESAEVLNQYATIADSRLSSIEDKSFEILSNRDIQRNLLQYVSSESSYEKYTAISSLSGSASLYSQLFTRWAMDKNIVSISFTFLDGKSVDTASRRPVKLFGRDDMVFHRAEIANGSCGWIANAAGDNIITLYRLIKDISGNGFKPFGVLIINVDAKHLFNYDSVVPQKYKPEIICVADDQVLSQSVSLFDRDDLLGFIKSTNTYDLVSLYGERYFISVRESSYNGWHYIYMLSNRDILRSVYNMNTIYILLLAAIVIVVITIGYGFANAISRPIARLTESMKVVEEGNYSAIPIEHVPKRLPAISEVVQLSRDFSQMIGKIDTLINEGYVKQLMIMEMKYKMLQQQINPHFLYNTLDTINWKAIETNNNDISVMVRALSRMLRGSIKIHDVVSICEDMRFVEDYISIQRIRFEERLKFKVEIDPGVYSCQVPRLTLQPIVENCIKHNLEKYAGVCEIRISSYVSGNVLEIRVDDNGKGADLQHIEMVLEGQAEAANSSIGLKNINERLKISFGEQYGIRVENMESGGTRVAVLLPFKSGAEREVSDEENTDSR